MRVLAALSGGVDSAVAAARAVEAGHDVTAVHLALAEGAAPGGHRSGCCTPDDARDARRIADVLGIPFYVWDLAERFAADVVDDFVAEYAAGRTPNPCVRCNERVKFAAVLDRAVALGFDAVCTGHYARLDGGVLRRAVDPAKDQSYVLATLRPDQLQGAVFPIGTSCKEEVRREATRRRLAVADKPDSHDVCFVPSGETARWLRQRLGEQPGPVIDATTGEVLGSHDGAYAFTVGQRRGLQLGRPAPDGRPRYVLSIEPAQRRVVVGPAELLDVGALAADAPVWSGGRPQLPVRCEAQVRAHAAPVPATAVEAPDGTLRVELDEPIRGVAAGQVVALYEPDPRRGDRVIGAARITGAAQPRAAAATA